MHPEARYPTSPTARFASVDITTSPGNNRLDCNPRIRLVFHTRNARLERKKIESTSFKVPLPVPIQIASVPHVDERTFMKDHNGVWDGLWFLRVLVIDQELLNHSFGIEMILEVVVDDDHIMTSFVALFENMFDHPENPRLAPDV